MRTKAVSAICGLCLLGACAPREKPEVAVHAAAKAGDAARLTRLLSGDPALARHRNPARNARQRTPLHEAATRDAAEVLLQNGAEVTAQDEFGWTPLHTAASAEIADLLIGKGADLNARAQRQLTPLHTVENAGAAEILIRHGADVNATGANQITPLVWHIESCRPQIVALLLAHGADPRAPRRKDGKTLLHLAADRSNPETVRLLLDKGLEVNVPDGIGATPLHYAAFKGHADVVRALLERGADPAIRLAHDAAVITFRGRGLPSEKSIAGLTALDIAEDGETRAVLEKHAHATPPPAAAPSPGTQAPAGAPSPAAGGRVSFEGKPLTEVQETLGQPKMRLQRGQRVILVYPDRELSSRDGVTVDEDRPTGR
ncbi:MAG: ankyrin repeat domain-containing protein [Kiritimatiellae bacterium]|nr:ankyrin repeat domain-containing protein [Kiritimatiellia bacterium]